MMNKDLKALAYTAMVARTILEDNLTLAKTLVQEINAQQFEGPALAAISDVLVANTFTHISDVHYYFLQHLDPLPDRQQLLRVAQAKRMFDEPPEVRTAWVRASANEETMLTGHGTDGLFCSILIRLAMAAQDFETVDKIHGILAAAQGEG